MYHVDPQGQEHLQIIGQKKAEAQAANSLFDPLLEKSLPLENREAHFRKALHERIDSVNETIYQALPPKISDFLRTLEPVLGKPTEYPLWFPGLDAVNFLRIAFKTPLALKLGTEFTEEAFRTLIKKFPEFTKGENAALVGLSRKALHENEEKILTELHSFSLKGTKPLEKRNQIHIRSYEKGHAEIKHGNAKNEIKRRKTQPNIENSSHFLNTKTMNKLAAKIVWENQTKIKRALKEAQITKASKEATIHIDISSKRIIGYMTKRNDTRLEEPLPLNKIRIVLRQNNAKHGGIEILTTYPIP
ncbi:hypothetical protein FAI41_03285 [Acetobacteraceae bacterium]|nr:hypothetical protein FAI41_03285 [Acetobacteraceae bacterium]